MTEYKVMAKSKHQKRFQCFGHHTDPKHADRNALSLVNSLWTCKVKIIITEDNGISNTVLYK